MQIILLYFSKLYLKKSIRNWEPKPVINGVFFVKLKLFGFKLNYQQYRYDRNYGKKLNNFYDYWYS